MKFKVKVLLYYIIFIDGLWFSLFSEGGRKERERERFWFFYENINDL